MSTFKKNLPVFSPTGASLVNTIYPALAAQQQELEQELEQEMEQKVEQEIVRVEEVELQAEERARFAVHQSIAASFRLRALSGSVTRAGQWR